MEKQHFGRGEVVQSGVCGAISMCLDRRVLVVDEAESKLARLSELLGDEFEVTYATSADEAVKKVECDNYDIAIFDRELAPRDCDGLLERILESSDQLRVIICTAVGRCDSVKQAINAGALTYVERPDDLTDLLCHVRRVCRMGEDADFEAAVQQRTLELDKSNRELQDFAYVVAHDLRSPLLTVGGYCEVLREECGEELDKNANEYMDHIVNGVERMGCLIDDLLSYAGLGRSSEPVATVDINLVLKQTRANLDSEIQKSHATLKVGRMPTVIGKQTHLLQLFQNLVENAIKFRSEKPPVVDIVATEVDGGFQFCVRDNGIGVAPQYFEKVFQVFQRLHNRREYSGTGIGLAVCKKIVEQHGGKIWLESELGKGTGLYFTLMSQNLPQQL